MYFEREIDIDISFDDLKKIIYNIIYESYNYTDSKYYNKVFKHLLSYNQKISDNFIGHLIINNFLLNNDNLHKECKDLINFQETILYLTLDTIKRNKEHIYSILDNINSPFIENEDISDFCIMNMNLMGDEIFNVLIRKGYDVKYFMKDYKKILQIAFTHSNISLLKFLLNNGMSIFSIEKNRICMLNLEMVLLLSKDDNFEEFVKLNKNSFKNHHYKDVAIFVLSYID